MKDNYDCVIVGGGFFGLYLAEFLAKNKFSVLVCEKEKDFMSRASYVNQARVHNGYHYPRSILTAFRSRVSFPRFVEEFGDCVESEFEKYYLIGKILGKITANQFDKFCSRIGAQCEVAPPRIKKLCNPSLIEEAFTTLEYAFDSHKLRALMLDRIQATNADLQTEKLVTRVSKTEDGLEVQVRSIEQGAKSFGESHTIQAKHVFNCSYSMMNFLLTESGVDMIPLKHEMTEMALVEVPDQLKKVGMTVMCGPFFSVMPFPNRNLHSFSHVRYTPHYEWNDNNGEKFLNAHEHYNQVKKVSAWAHMIRDAQRYIPILSECRYQESIWEVKTVLPRSEADDSRPILFKPNYGLEGFHCVMGGKIDNVYDAIEITKQLCLN